MWAKIPNKAFLLRQPDTDIGPSATLFELVWYLIFNLISPHRALFGITWQALQEASIHQQTSTVNLQHWQRSTRMADKRAKDTKPNKGSSVKGKAAEREKQSKQNPLKNPHRNIYLLIAKLTVLVLAAFCSWLVIIFCSDQLSYVTTNWYLKNI